MSTERRCADCGGHAAGEDRFCAGCGLPLPVVDARTETALAGGPLLLDADLTDRAGRLGLDFGAIWIADLLVPTRIERAFVDLDCLTLADAAALPADAQRRMWSVGAKSIADLREAVAAVVADADRWRAIVSARTGDWNDPRAPALPPAVRKVARERAIDLSQVSLAQLDLTPRLVSVVGQGQFRTVDDLRRLTNADLRRRLGVFQHEAHPALREALEAWAAEVSAGAPPVSLVGAELDARDPVTPPPSLQHLIASAETALGRIAASLSSLPERERGIVMARYGLDGMPSQTLEDIGRRLGISRARVSQIEQAATRRSGPVAAAIRVARDTLAALRERLLLGGDDPRFAAALCGAGMPERQIAGLLALADESAPHDPVASAGQRLDEAAIAALARWGPLPLSEAARRIGEAIGEDGLPRLDQAAIGERLRVVGPGLVGPDDHVDLPPVPSSLPNDKRIRRLNALIGVLERLGPSHYDEVAAALSVRLPAEYALDAGDVHAWLLRYSDVFAWVGKGRFGLREDGFGHREPVEAGDGRAVRQRKGVGDEIVTLLLERGPLAEDEVVAHLLQRFRVRPESISVAIRYDRRHRFAIDASGLVGLVAHAGADRPDVASSTGSASDPAAPPHPIGS